MTEVETAVATVVWYHGTRRGFRGRGGVVLPRWEHGGPGTTAPTNPGRTSPPDADRYVFITRDRDVAVAYAHAAPGRGRPKVLTVQPAGEVTRDPEHGYATDAWRCGWATVLATEVLPKLPVGKPARYARTHQAGVTGPHPEGDPQ